MLLPVCHCDAKCFDFRVKIFTALLVARRFHDFISNRALSVAGHRQLRCDITMEIDMTVRCRAVGPFKSSVEVNRAPGTKVQPHLHVSMIFANNCSFIYIFSLTARVFES